MIRDVKGREWQKIDGRWRCTVHVSYPVGASEQVTCGTDTTLEDDLLDTLDALLRLALAEHRPQ